MLTPPWVHASPTAKGIEHDTSRSPEQLLADAAAILTAAARQGDIGDFVAHALTAAAANIGSTDELLARPGSWESDLVRQLVVGTAGPDDEYLNQHRTEPVRVILDVTATLDDFGLGELYDEAEKELWDRRNALVMRPVPFDPNNPVHARAMATPELFVGGEPEFSEYESQDEADRLDRLEERVEEQRHADLVAYGEAFQAQVISAASEMNLTVPVEVEVSLDYITDAPAYEFGTAEAELWQRAKAATPLPSSGIAPSDYPAGQSIPRGRAFRRPHADRTGRNSRPGRQLSQADQSGVQNTDVVV